MSRRRGEFEHRTSIFEGAFRAWSHLGGLDPEDMERMSVSDLDPLSNPIENDSRLIGKKEPKGEGAFNLNGTKRRQYPYEPLPRSGLSHPYVQAILSPWLGPDADNDAIQLGLTTLRTWWQHRRKGESGSAIAALGTEKMKGVVEGYTRHFFTLSHCLIVNDKEQPPRTLYCKMKELEKARNKRSKRRYGEEEEGSMTSMGGGGGGGVLTDDLAAGIAADLTNDELSPLERLHVAQQRQLAVEGGIHTVGDSMHAVPTLPIIKIKNKCLPGKPDLPAIVDAVNHAATQLAHSGRAHASAVPTSVVSGGLGSSSASYGDPDSIPIVFVSENGDAMIAMSVDGITCAHCVKIVETVLRGCNGNKSPVDGLLDAAADRVLCAVLIRVDRISYSKRIAFEAARNLAMVGYTAKAKAMSPTVERDGEPIKMSLDEMFKAFEEVGHNDPTDLFDWSAPCSCPDNGVARDDCARHGQMTSSIFDAFETRAMAVHQYLAGNKQMRMQNMQQQQQVDNGQYHRQQGQQVMLNDIQPLNDTGMGMDLFGGSGAMHHHHGMAHGGDLRGGNAMLSLRRERNPSIISFGNHRMSLNGRMSEVSYGRAMSGLSALSIDWENMDDFDINVDHSEHINNGMGGHQMGQAAVAVGAMGGYDLEPKQIGGSGGRRSSMRQHLMLGGPGAESDSHVSFKL